MKSQIEWKIKIDIPPEAKNHPLFKKLRDDMYERASAKASEALENPILKAQVLYAASPKYRQQMHFKELQRVHGKEKLAMAVKLSKSTRYDYRHWLKFDTVEMSKELAKYEKR